MNNGLTGAYPVTIDRYQQAVRFRTLHHGPGVFVMPRLRLDAGPTLLYRTFTMKGTPAIDALCCPPAPDELDLRPVEGPDADEELASLAKAVGHPARVQILRLLIRRETCVCGDIVEELPLAQSTVSQHLKVLKEAGLIRGDVAGPRICYCIDPRTLKRFRALVGGL